MKQPVGIALGGLLLLVSCTDSTSTPVVNREKNVYFTGATVGNIINASIVKYPSEYVSDLSIVGNGNEYYYSTTYSNLAISSSVLTYLVSTNIQYSEPFAGDVTTGIIDSARNAYLNSENNFAVSNINYLTTISAALSMFYAKTRADEFAVNLANSEINDLYGFDVSKVEYTVDPDKLKNSSVLLKNYLINTAISALSYGELTQQRISSSFDFIEVVKQDVSSDGLLDGIGDFGAITFNNVQVTSNTYRHELAKKILSLSEYNGLPFMLSKVELLPIAISINDNKNSIYGADAIIVIDEGGPTIESFTPLDGSTITGDNTMAATATDITGIKDAEFFIDGVHYSYTSTTADIKTNFTVSLFQTKGTIGQHTITVEVLNNYGTKTSQTNTLFFDNR